MDGEKTRLLAHYKMIWKANAHRAKGWSPPSLCRFQYIHLNLRISDMSFTKSASRSLNPKTKCCWNSLEVTRVVHSPCFYQLIGQTQWTACWAAGACFHNSQLQQALWKSAHWSQMWLAAITGQRQIHQKLHSLRWINYWGESQEKSDDKLQQSNREFPQRTSHTAVVRVKGNLHGTSFYRAGYFREPSLTPRTTPWEAEIQS